ncbi:DUF262 domain-containing HNH endonuclease family protein [Candidatus Poseidoniales archaeon]|jgi:uncharacterized protein with ParB-like and HNH nuclease domain|nr:DUF262 domain-containing HNH endonuclease family protein [Candidatus Poseidoniales archaeon]
MSTLPNTDHFEFRKAFAKGHFQIPEFQRDYDWKKGTLESLITDLMEFTDDHPNPDTFSYFVGNLILWNDNHSRFIVDGQQRTTALTIASCALRDVMIEAEMYQEAEKLHKSLIQNSDDEIKWQYWPKKGKDRTYLGFFQTIPDLKFSVILDQNIDQDGEDFYKIQSLLPKFTLPQDYELKHQNAKKIKLTQTIKSGESRDKIAMDIILKDGKTLETGDTIICKQNDRKTYVANHGKPHGSRRMFSHYKACKNEITSHVKNKTQPEQVTFYSNLASVFKRIGFTTTEFSELEEALYYFDKMNDSDNRLSLNAGDLFRTYIHRITNGTEHSDEENKNIMLLWNRIESNLIVKQKSNDVAEFMWAWLLSRGIRVSKRKVWSKFKSLLDQLGDYDGRQKLISSLANCSDLYRQIKRPYPQDPEYTILSSIPGKQHQPFLLLVYYAAKATGDPDDVKSYLRWAVRMYSYLMLRGTILPTQENVVPSNVIYQKIESWNKFYWEGEDDAPAFEDISAISRLNETLNHVSREIEELVSGRKFTTLIDGVDCPDPEVFDSLEVSQSQANLILTYVEWYLRGFQEDPTWAQVGLEIEHVMPQNPKMNDEKTEFVEWSDWTMDVQAKFVDLLGNRCLLPAGANNKLGNKSYEEKLNLAEHGYMVRAASWKVVEKLVEQNQEWTQSSITKHGNFLAEKLVTIFGNEDFLKKDFF